MSFFDEVETTVANTRFLSAMEDHGPIVLPLKPIEQLQHLEAELRRTVSIDVLLAAGSTAAYLFKQYLVLQGQEDAVQLLDCFESYAKTGSKQRLAVAQRVVNHDHPLLGQAASAATPSSPTAAAGAAAYTATAGDDGSPPTPTTSAGVALSSHTHKGSDSTTLSAPWTASSSATATHSSSSAASTAAASSSGVTVAAASSSSSSPSAVASTSSPSRVTVAAAPCPPRPPCLELVLAKPLTSHATCAFLRANAAQKLAQVQQMIDSCAGSSGGGGGVGSDASKPLPSSLFDPLASLLRQRLGGEFIEGFLLSPLFDKYVQLEEYSRREVKLDEFRIFRVLGRGAFGAVSAVQKIDTHAIFAMKEMGKKQVKADQSEWMVLNEMKVLSRTSSPFVLGLQYAFHEDETLYLIFAMCAGGDLKFHLRAQPSRCFDAERARFYAAEILLGLEHLHSLDIVYRDLKPNNILLHQSGHLVISDLGLAIKLRRNKVLKHLAGTAGYWAPEIVMKSGTFKTSDFWSFGVLLFEMLTGQRPECSCDKKTKEWCPFGQRRSMEENALDPAGVLKIDVVYPPSIAGATKDLLQSLFNPDPLARLGSTGIGAIKNHAYFACIDWERMARCELTPPFVPESRTVNAHSIGEVGDFAQANARLKNVVLGVEDDKIYESFKYTSPEGVQKEILEALMKQDDPRSAANAADQLGGQHENNNGCCAIL